jgi:hypothetical protein
MYALGHGLRDSEGSMYASAAARAVDNDDARFRQEKTANRVLADVPKGGELGDREVPFEVGRRIVLRIHRGSAFKLDCGRSLLNTRFSSPYPARKQMLGERKLVKTR